jgi:hypothetical protein
MIRVSAVTVLLAAAGALLPGAAAAQSFGSGPLTGTLTATEPTSGALNFGRVKVAPGLTVAEIGYDSNVFDEAENQKEDFVIRATPDVSVFTLLRFAMLSAYAGSELTYYKDYTSERAVGREYRGRLEMLLSRFRPFIGAGQTRKRTRPNGEIDIRAEQDQEEVSGGVAFELGPTSLVYASAVRFRSGFESGVEDGVDLPTTLNHDSYRYSAGVQTDVTPITSLTVSGALQRDEFATLSSRNSESRVGTASLRIGAGAMVSGVVTVSYRDFQPVDPLIRRFQGVTTEAAVTYSFLELGRLSAAVNRGLQYSFDDAEAYYVENTLRLSYTHRIFTDIDVQLNGSVSRFEYGYREGLPPREDELSSVAGSLGYNLRNRTRVGLNYELARRRSPAFATRNYDRTRIFLSWQYAF